MYLHTRVKSILNFIKSIRCAFKGIVTSFHGQRNIKIQMIIAILVIILSYYYQITQTELFIILIIIFLVLIFEMINTALEKTIDFISTEKNKKIGEIKDIMAGATLMACILSVIIGLIIFIPHIFK